MNWVHWKWKLTKQFEIRGSCLMKGKRQRFSLIITMFQAMVLSSSTNWRTWCAPAWKNLEWSYRRATFRYQDTCWSVYQPALNRGLFRTGTSLRFARGRHRRNDSRGRNGGFWGDQHWPVQTGPVETRGIAGEFDHQLGQLAGTQEKTSKEEKRSLLGSTENEVSDSLGP